MSRLTILASLVVALGLGAVALWLGHRSWEGYEKGEAHEVVLEEEGNGAPNGVLTLHQLLERISLPSGSRILEIELESHDGALFYEIEFLTPEGAVRALLVDPRSGRVMARHGWSDEE